MAGPTDSTEKNRICRFESELSKSQLTIAQLLEKEGELSNVIDSIPIAAFVIDSTHRVTHCNRAFEYLTGFRKKDLLHTSKQWSPFYTRKRKTLADLVVDNAARPQIEDYYGEDSRRISYEDGVYTVELFFPHLGNKGKWIFCTASPLKDLHGVTIGAVETLQDLTSRKEVEEALFKSEEKSRIIQDQIEDGYYEVDLMGRVIFFNDAFSRILGYSRKELTGMSYKVFVGSAYTKRIFSMYNRVIKTGKSLKFFEWEIVRKDKSKRIVQFSVSLMKNASDTPIGFRGIVRDVTDKRKDEKELRKYKNHLEELVRERTYELNQANRLLKKEIEERKKTQLNLLKEKQFSEDIIEALPCVFYLYNKEGKFLKWNKNLEIVTGYSLSDMGEIRALDFFQSPEKEMVAERISEVFEKGKSFAKASILTKDGKRLAYYLTGVKTIIGKTDYLVGVGIDYAELEQAKIALQESENRLRAILSAVTDCMIMIDWDFTIKWANDQAEGYFGKSLTGRKCHEILHGLNSPCVPCIGQQCIEEGGTRECERQCTGPNGSRVDFWCTTSLVRKYDDGTPEMVLELLRDITEKKAYEAEAVRVGQLASIGELAAGVAHEINNPINGILNYAQILIDQNEVGSLHHQIMKKISQEGERVTTIVNNLLSYARVSSDEYVAVTLGSILDSCLGLMGEQLMKDGITLKTNIHPHLPRLFCNSQQLQQVFLNVISNARYALNQKYGRAHRNKIIEIRAEKTRMKRRKALRIIVCDHGTGIPPDILDKIGSPFFTTKPMNEGTGLGLNISHGIIKNHGGRLWFDSTVGEFTKVIIDLPAR
jgi:PAS domain S-box-containing protein